MKPGEIWYRPTTGNTVELTGSPEALNKIDEMDLAVLDAKLTIIHRRVRSALDATRAGHESAAPVSPAPAGWSRIEGGPERPVSGNDHHHHDGEQAHRVPGQVDPEHRRQDEDDDEDPFKSAG